MVFNKETIEHFDKQNELSIEANKKAKEIIKTLENKELWFRPSELKQMLKLIVNRL